ncbi:MAG: hypothetical protein A2096_10665 [Spirochaetes bacterium GWF1_41_5]|nr:MAG: hypothetical protein A2096_10665 [Spirochaetes bacterium GWF1_41_5]HBE02024.1 hypothetical protein [Spirochaetia bacterium]
MIINRSNIFQIVSISWNEVLFSFLIDKYAFLKIECRSRSSLFKTETGEAASIGRIALCNLIPDTEYEVIFSWGKKKKKILFHTLPGPQGKCRSEFVVIADPHISEKKENRKGRLFAESALLLQGIISELNNRNIDFILIAGDLTNTGGVNEYKKIDSILKISKHKILAVPGDHDLPGGETRAWRHYFGPLQWSLNIKDFRIIGINSAAKTLDKTAVSMLNKKNQMTYSLILTHVALLPNPACNRGGKSDPVLTGNEYFLKKLKSGGALIYAGHQNIPLRTEIDRLQQINVPQPSQYLCGYYLVRRFNNGFYHTFMPVESEILRQYSRIEGDLAAKFYHENQWQSAYREGCDAYARNFVIRE